MSLKPRKKSDFGKSWMKPRRDVAKLIAPEYHLIVSEGERTEPCYFKSICDIVNAKFRNRIHLDVEGEGNNTVNLFKKAERKVASSSNGYRHVWIVYDKDDFPSESFNAVINLCQASSNSETTYHAVWSNQCIEVWFLLHFSFLQSAIDRKDCFTKLDGYLKRVHGIQYRKNSSGLFGVLYPFLEVAIQNAKKLNEINQGKLPSDCNPGTKVYQLLEVLKPYIQNY